MKYLPIDRYKVILIAWTQRRCIMSFGKSLFFFSPSHDFLFVIWIEWFWVEKTKLIKNRECFHWNQAVEIDTHTHTHALSKPLLMNLWPFLHKASIQLELRKSLWIIANVFHFQQEKKWAFTLTMVFLAYSIDSKLAESCCIVRKRMDISIFAISIT